MWIIYAVIAAAIWGLVYVLDEQTFKYFTIPQFSLFGTICSLIIWTAYFLISKEEVGLTNIHNYPPKAWFILCLTTLVCFLGSFAIYTSIKQSNATLAAMIETSYPVFTFLFAWLITREVQITPYAMAGFVLIISGVALTYYGTSNEKSPTAPNHLKSGIVHAQFHPLSSLSSSLLVQQLQKSKAQPTGARVEVTEPS